MSYIFNTMNTKDNRDIMELKEIDALLKKYKPYYKMYQKLSVIKNVKEGMTRGEAAEAINVHVKTAENWVKAYNKNGLDSLESNYSNSGLRCKLSDEQLKDLKKTLKDSEIDYDTKMVKKLIKERYDVDYSIKQTWYILKHKLGFKYKGNKLII